MTEFQIVLCVICLIQSPQWSQVGKFDFWNYFYAYWLPIFPYVTGVKFIYCSQGIPTTGFYLNHAFMLWHTLKWSVIKLTSIHQKKFFHLLIIQFVLSIVTSQYWGQFFVPISPLFRELPHIYTPIKAEIKSGYHILFYRRNGICRDLLTRGALFTQPSVCTILADPIRTRCRGRVD